MGTTKAVNGLGIPETFDRVLRTTTIMQYRDRLRIFTSSFPSRSRCLKPLQIVKLDSLGVPNERSLRVIAASSWLGASLCGPPRVYSYRRKSWITVDSGACFVILLGVRTLTGTLNSGVRLSGPLRRFRSCRGTNWPQGQDCGKILWLLDSSFSLWQHQHCCTLSTSPVSFLHLFFYSRICNIPPLASF